MNTFDEAAQHLAEAGALLHGLGMSPGATGNLSVRMGDEVVVSASGSRLRALGPESLARVGVDGEVVHGPRPTKEKYLHLAVYRVRSDVRAIVHLHSPAAVALSCLPVEPGASALRPLTAYVHTRLGGPPTLRYAPPGDDSLAPDVERAARDHDVFLLASHGMVTCGASLDHALDLAEELEAAALAQLHLGDAPVRTLTPDQLRLVGG